MLASDFTAKDQARFWEKVDMAAQHRCWNWYAATCPHGYGRFGIRRNPKTTILLSHRIALTLACGMIPDELDVLHDCDNPSCCNPEHLWLGTARDNMHDAMLKGRSSKPPLWQGENHPRAKLTAEQVLAIRSDTRSKREIAFAYGLNLRTVFRIRNGTSWSVA